MKPCVVITSIHDKIDIPETTNIEIIIVGDKKSPAQLSFPCTYLDIEQQRALFPELVDLVPYNHYTRKNLGYLYAIQHGYDVIFDTDDDNRPLFDFKAISTWDFSQELSASQHNFNIYRCYTLETVWPRGYPHNLINQPCEVSAMPSTKKPALIYGLCDGNTDVDAIYRLAHRNQNLRFVGEPCVINNQNLVIFNSQSTFWLDPSIFGAMYLPVSVTSRFADILRAYVAHYLLKSLDKNLAIRPNLVYQQRNQHNLLHDLAEELFMYQAVEKIPELLQSLVLSSDLDTMMLDIYHQLYHHQIVTKMDLELLPQWLTHIKIKRNV